MIENSQPFVIIFKEDQQLPFEIEKTNIFTNKQQSIVLTKTNSKIVNYISDFQKKAVEAEIKKLKIFCDLTSTKHFNVTQNYLKQKNESLSDYAPNFVFGSNSLKNNGGDYKFDRTIDLNEKIQTQEFDSYDRNNIVVLIYDGCNLQELKACIAQYKNYEVVIFVNGKKNMQQFLENFTNYKEKQQLWSEYNQFLQHYSTSPNHAFYCDLEELKDMRQSQCQEQLKDIGLKIEDLSEKEISSTACYLLATSIRFEQPQIVRWIYNGILKYFDPKFAIVVSSNLLFKEKGSVQKLEYELQQYENTTKNLPITIGLYWQEQFTQNTGKLFNHANYFEFGNQNIRMDSIFPVAKFHNPISCIYNWKQVSQFKVDFVNEIFNYQENFGVYGLNDILPTIIFNENQQQIRYISNCQSITQLNHKDEAEYFQFYCFRNYNIMSQLRKKQLLKRQNISFFQLLAYKIQKILSRLFFFEQYFGLSLCLFFSFQCPYQVVSYLFNSQVGYTALSIIIPMNYGLNTLSIIILSTLYGVKDKFLQKHKNDEVFMKFKNQDKKIMYEKYDQNETHDIFQSIEEEEENQFKISILSDYNAKVKEFKININESEEIYIGCKEPKKFKKISKIYKLLLQNQQFLDFIVILSTIANLILCYGPNIYKIIEIYQLVLLLSAITYVIFMFCEKGKLILAYIFNFSLMSFICQVYMIQQKIGTPDQQIQRKRALASQLIINCILFYVFICIESFFKYNGYILVGLVTALTLSIMIRSILDFLGHCCRYKYQYTQEEIVAKTQEIKEFILTLDLIKVSEDQIMKGSSCFILQDHKNHKANHKKAENETQDQQKQNLNDMLQSKNVGELWKKQLKIIEEENEPENEYDNEGSQQDPFEINGKNQINIPQFPNQKIKQ